MEGRWGTPKGRHRRRAVGEVEANRTWAAIWSVRTSSLIPDLRDHMLILGAESLAFFSYTQQLSNLGVQRNEEGEGGEGDESSKQASRGKFVPIQSSKSHSIDGKSFCYRKNTYPTQPVPQRLVPLVSGMREPSVAGCRKSRGVPVTLASSPVGMRIPSVTTNWSACSCRKWSDTS